MLSYSKNIWKILFSYYEYFLSTRYWKYTRGGWKLGAFNKFFQHLWTLITSRDSHVSQVSTALIQSPIIPVYLRCSQCGIHACNEAYCASQGSLITVKQCSKHIRTLLWGTPRLRCSSMVHTLEVAASWTGAEKTALTAAGKKPQWR